MDRKKMNECLVRTQNGDKAAYSLFYEEAAKGVFAFLYGYYRNYARTEEAMQETFYKALKNISLYRAGSDARVAFADRKEYCAQRSEPCKTRGMASRRKF